MTSQGKNVLIGIFALVALAVLIWGLLFLNPRTGDGGQILRVRFASVAGIQDGTRVTFAGRPVGRVVAINQIYDAREQAQGPLGEIYFYEVILAIDSSIKVYTTDKIVLNTTGLFGEKSIAIIPEQTPPGEEPVRVTDQILYGRSADRMEQTFTQVVKMTDQMSETFALINNILIETEDDVQKMIRSVTKVADGLVVTIDGVNQGGLIPSATCAMEGLCSVMSRVDGRLEQYEQDGFFDHFGSLVQGLNGAVQQAGPMFDTITTFAQNGIEIEQRIEEIWPTLEVTLANLGIASRKGRQILDHIERIAASVADGEGTLGRLLQSDELYLRMMRLVDQVQTLMNDLNQYGLLFHMNKGWQRQRSGRAMQMANLTTPGAFATYFDRELDQISAGVARVEMALGKARAQGVTDDPNLSREVVSLIHRIDGLEKELEEVIR